MDTRAVGIARVVLLTSLLAGAARADVLILRDGSRRTGALQACAGSQCRFAGKTIAAAEIAWIGFGGAGGKQDMPPAVADSSHDELHLADGSVATGTLEGISLGEVALADRSFDRASVSWLHFAGAPGMTAPQDLFVLRDGSTRNGALQGCTNGGCTLDGQTQGRDRLVWVGLEQGTSTPPHAPDPTRDAVHLRDQSVHVAHLLGVDARQVRTDHGAYPRANVAWIYLAPPAPAPPNQDYEPAPTDDRPGQGGEGGESGGTGGGTGKGGGTKTGAGPPAGDSGGNRAPQGGNGGPPSGSRTYTRGGLWTGTIDGSFAMDRDGFQFTWTVHVDVRLREFGYPLHRVPDGKIIGEGMWLEPEGSQVSNQLAASGHGISCAGQGAIALTVAPDERGYNHPSTIFRKTVHGDLTPALGFDVPEGEGEYTVGINARPADKYDYSCVSPAGGYHDTDGYLVPQLGHHPPQPSPRMDPAIRTIRGGKMEGEYSGPVPPYSNVQARWLICREGVDCSTPPPPPAPAPSKTPCPPPTSERAVLDNLQQQEAAYLCHAQDAFQKVRALQNQADQYRSDFELVSRNCNLWMVARTLLGFMVGKFSPRGEIEIPVTQFGPDGSVIGTTWQVIETEAGKQFYLVLDGLDKMTSGDSSWVLPNTEYKDWVSLEDAYEGFQIAYDALKESSPESMLEGIQECGAPGPDNIYQDAVHFLRLLEEEHDALGEENRLLNIVRQKDIDLFSEWSKYRDACREYQECIHGDPSSCDEPQTIEPARSPDGKCPPLGPSATPP